MNIRLFPSKWLPEDLDGETLLNIHHESSFALSGQVMSILHFFQKLHFFTQSRLHLPICRIPHTSIYSHRRIIELEGPTCDWCPSWRLGVCLQHNALYENVTVEECLLQSKRSGRNKKHVSAKLLPKHNSNLDFKFQLSFSSTFVTIFFCCIDIHVFGDFMYYVGLLHLFFMLTSKKLGRSNDFIQVGKTYHHWGIERCKQKLWTSFTFSSWENQKMKGME